MSIAAVASRIDEARGGVQRAREILSGTRGKTKPAEEAPPQKQGGMSASDIGHTVLDVAGLIPVVGAAADLINAGWYAAEGDYVNAGLSALGAIPGIGDAATATKLGVKGADAAIGAAKAADDVNDARKAGNAAKGAGGSSEKSGGIGSGQGGSRGNGGNGGANGSSKDGGFDDDDYENKWDRWADDRGYGVDDYSTSRDQNYGSMSQNQAQNRQFDSAMREAEQDLGRPITRDEQAEIHRQNHEGDGKYRTREEIRDSFRDQYGNTDDNQ
jgi:hypothetical protein